MLRRVLAARKAQTARIEMAHLPTIEARRIPHRRAGRHFPNPSTTDHPSSFAPRAMDHSPGFLAHVEARRPHVHEVTVAETLAALAADSNARLIDVREDREWMAGHAAGATHTARGVIERDIETLVPALDTPLYLYCGGGFRSALSAHSLQQMGYTAVHSIAGGWRAWEEAAAPVERPETGKHINGFGGVFFKSPDPEGLRSWYARHLGVASESWGGMFPIREHANPAVEGYQAWSVMPSGTTYFGDSGQSFMLNYRVRDLGALLTELRAHDVWIDEKVEDTDYGRFAWIRDADGNRIELWQPAGETLP